MRNLRPSSVQNWLNAPGNCATGGGAEHHRDLRYPPGGPDHRREHLPDRVQCYHALGQPDPARLPEREHRHLVAYREIDRVRDVPAAVDAHRAAHAGHVRGVRDRPGAVDLPACTAHTGVVPGYQQPQRALVKDRPQPRLGIAEVRRGLVRNGGGDGHGVLQRCPGRG